MGKEEPIIAELGLTRKDIKALTWILHCWLQQYLDNEGSELKTRAQALHDALSEV